MSGTWPFGRCCWLWHSTMFAVPNKNKKVVQLWVTKWQTWIFFWWKWWQTKCHFQQGNKAWRPYSPEQVAVEVFAHFGAWQNWRCWQCCMAACTSSEGAGWICLCTYAIRVADCVHEGTRRRVCGNEAGVMRVIPWKWHNLSPSHLLWCISSIGSPNFLFKQLYIYIEMYPLIQCKKTELIFIFSWEIIQFFHLTPPILSCPSWPWWKFTLKIPNKTI